MGDDSLEAKMLQMVVAQFCKAPSADDNFVQNFDRRVEACKDQGRQLQILPRRASAREHVFCRCRSVIYDCLRTLSSWSLTVWLAELCGVCIVLYLSMEPNLIRMGSSQRRDMLA